MKNLKHNFMRDIRGTIMPMAVLLIAAIIPLSGLGVDIGYFSVLRSSLDRATEAASTAGAQEYFRKRADGGRAVNEAVRVFKMNVTNDTMIGNFYNPTGPGNPSTLTYSKTFTQGDNINNIYRGSEISLTVMTDINRGKVTVTSTLVPKPFFAYFLANRARITITKEAELPPYDVVFVVDLSGSMRYATFNTYIGTANRQMVGLPGLGVLLPNVVLTQSESQPGVGSRITANGFVTTVASISDVLINTPGLDIPSTATYSTGRPIYKIDPDRGYIVNTDRSTGLRRLALSGLTINDLMTANISAEDRQLPQTFNDNGIINNNFASYFNRAASYIEPIASASYGVMAFVDTVRIYGTAALKLGLVTFESSSYTNDRISTYSAPELKATNVSRTMRRTLPYVGLVNPVDFSTIVDKLTIMSASGNGTLVSPIRVNAYPDGGTNINAGLDNAKWTLDRSDRPNSEKIIILFTDGEPTSHSFSALGTKVKSLTDAGVRIHSVVLTLAVSQSAINEFKYQVETVGKAEPVIFISDPAKLKDAFLQIADELGLKLVN